MAAAAPAAAAVSGMAQPSPAPRDSSFDPWIEIDRSNLQHNVAAIARLTKRPILAVIKNNGYGGGVANIARVLDQLAPVAGFAVVKLHEAVALRDAAIRKPILLMGPFAASELDVIVARRITPMVYTPIGDALERTSRRFGRRVPIHVCVDTGIGRVGVPYRHAAPLIKDLAVRPSIRIDGTMMTFTEDEAFDREQLKRFDDLTAGLGRDGITLGTRHAASSFALFQHPEGFLDMVRPGMAVFGVYSENAFRTKSLMELRPAIALKTRVAYVKQLEPGDSAGYERAYRAERPVWIATLPVGHADGLPRNAAKGGRVRIGGSLYPIVASVSASHSIVEIGDERRVEIGDIATIFDATDGSRPEDFGASCDASVYDLLMHLNADLPRRVS
jgi:alanine racemase